MYSFISHTFVRDGHALLIGDPGVCEFNDQLISFSEENRAFIRIDSLPSGGYFSYHISGNSSAAAEELAFLYDSLRPEEIGTLRRQLLGSACTSFTKTFFVCEEQMAFDASRCYFLLEPEALYDLKGIREKLREKKSLSRTDSLLSNALACHEADGYIMGKDILNITGSQNVPQFLRSIRSTHWSADVARRLSDIPASPIIGGVASYCGTDFVKVYGLYSGDAAVGLCIL